MTLLLCIMLGLLFPAAWLLGYMAGHRSGYADGRSDWQEGYD